MSPHDDAFEFFNRPDADKQGQSKPHLEEAAMALLLLDVHSAPGKVTHPFALKKLSLPFSYWAVMAVMLLDLHSAPGKVSHPYEEHFPAPYLGQ